jgi:hypothetical protein
MNREDLLRIQHESVAKYENKRMRERFNIRTYKEGDQWEAQQNRKATGAKGGKTNLQRPWAKKGSNDER